MPYDYTAKEPGSNKNKYIAAIIVVVAVGLIGFGLRPTGQVTANPLCSTFEECQKIADSATSSLQLCGNERSELIEAKSAFETSLSSCETDRKYYTTSYVQKLADYRSLVRNTALEKCCTEADAERGAIKNFGINDNRIICNAGEYGLNCRTGGTSY